MFWDGTIDTNKLKAIIDLARKATVLQPYAPKNWEALARLLLRTGEAEEAIAALNEAISRLPAEPRLHLMLAGAYHRTERLDRVREVIHGVPTIPSDDREMAIYRLEVLMETRVSEDSAQIAKDTLALDPTNVKALEVLGQASRKIGSPEMMIPICQGALKHDPMHTRARYELVVALTMLGRSEDARQLIDLNQFVRIIEVAPKGFANAKAFEAALASEIARNPTLKRDPIGKATKGGFHTDSLPHPGDQRLVFCST